MEFSGCINDEAFGPTVQGCRGDFDFTIRFEKILLSLVPASVFIALSLSRIAILYQRRSVVGGRLLQFSKLVRTKLTLSRSSGSSAYYRTGLANRACRTATGLADTVLRTISKASGALHLLRGARVCFGTLHVRAFVSGTLKITAAVTHPECIFIPHHLIRRHSSKDAVARVQELR